jgi:hypothetical protein
MPLQAQQCTTRGLISASQGISCSSCCSTGRCACRAAASTPHCIRSVSTSGSHEDGSSAAHAQGGDASGSDAAGTTISQGQQLKVQLKPDEQAAAKEVLDYYSLSRSMFAEGDVVAQLGGFHVLCCAVLRCAARLVAVLRVAFQGRSNMAAHRPLLLISKVLQDSVCLQTSTAQSCQARPVVMALSPCPTGVRVDADGAKLLNKLVGCLNKDGKKAKAHTIVVDAMMIINDKLAKQRQQQ